MGWMQSILAPKRAKRQERSEAELTHKLRVSEARAEAVQKAALDAIVLIDQHGAILDFNPAAEAMFGHRRADVLGKPLADFAIPERLRAAHHAGMARYVATRSGPVVSHRVELPALRASGEEFPAEIAIVPIEEGADLAFVGFIRDISERRRQEERRNLLTQELTHRGKNLLTIIQSITHRTLRDHPPEVAREVLDRRLAALARSHSALAADSTGAPLIRIITEELDGFSDRVHKAGPDIHLKASAAQTFGLIVHELATNAVKHGALSTQSGVVEVRWSVTAPPDARFHFEWRERNGPVITVPERLGFGRTVLEQVAAHDLATTPTITFAPDGLIYRLDAPLDVLSENR